MLTLTQVTEKLEAAKWDVPAAEYHAGAGLSCSRFLSAGVYTDSEEQWTPDEYRWPLKDDDSEELEIGTLAHLFYYEPHMRGEYAVRPVKEDGKLHANNSKEYLAWLKTVPAGATIVSGKTLAVATAVVEALEKEPAMSRYREHHIISTETCYRTRCPITDLEFRIKPDRLRWIERARAIISEYLVLEDLKTTKDAKPFEFRRSCYTFDYWRRCAHYRWVLACILGLTSEEDFREFCQHFRSVMIAAETTARHRVAVYDVSDYKLRQAHQVNMRSLVALARCIEKQDFLPAWRKAPMVLS